MTDQAQTQTTPAARAIARLNAQLLALADGDAPPQPAAIERTAKAISSLVRSVEQAQGFLDAQGEGERVGYALTDAARDDLLARIRLAAARGEIPGVTVIDPSGGAAQ